MEVTVSPPQVFQTGVDIWLLRGIPRGMREDELVRFLQTLGFPKPTFWYVPSIRKTYQENRGYAFVGYDPQTLYTVSQLLHCRPGHQFRLERSTAISEQMVNNAMLWDNIPASVFFPRQAEASCVQDRSLNVSPQFYVDGPAEHEQPLTVAPMSALPPMAPAFVQRANVPMIPGRQPPQSLPWTRLGDRPRQPPDIDDAALSGEEWLARGLQSKEAYG
mmetsp:Transcript_3371/g.7927  ORF Transcript_3371/g.7927 Transcript_3371/m.7927 type:complete len:218 (+) Transcript_3371:105-758(+)